MKKSPIIELLQNMLLDKDYINFEKLYNEENIIDKKLLIKLLNKYEDLYIVFLKINILIYRYDTKDLNNDLQDFLHYKSNSYYIDDLEAILRHYYNNYDRCKKVISYIISDNLRPESEIKLLKKIFKRSAEKELNFIKNEK